mmetsp:Transcript_102499/g.235156  ORF Transcript_102499/g.235156 Transcript_102499/m.235156 type:complete len:240 (-) Transcript_102499:279-998(-)
MRLPLLPLLDRLRRLPLHVTDVAIQGLLVSPLLFSVRQGRMLARSRGHGTFSKIRAPSQRMLLGGSLNIIITQRIPWVLLRQHGHDLSASLSPVGIRCGRPVGRRIPHLARGRPLEPKHSQIRGIRGSKRSRGLILGVGDIGRNRKPAALVDRSHKNEVRAAISTDKLAQFHIHRDLLTSTHHLSELIAKKFQTRKHLILRQAIGKPDGSFAEIQLFARGKILLCQVSGPLPPLQCECL